MQVKVSSFQYLLRYTFDTTVAWCEASISNLSFLNPPPGATVALRRGIIHHMSVGYLWGCLTPNHHDAARWRTRSEVTSSHQTRGTR